MLRTAQRIARVVAVLSFVVAAALLIAVAQTGSFGETRLPVLLTAIGVTVGAGLLDLLLLVFSERRAILTASVVPFVVSQIAYLLLVWTEWRTQSTLWRVWWISAITTLLAAHLGLFRMARMGRVGFVERGTFVGSYITGILLIAFSLRSNLLVLPPSIYIWATVLIGSMTAVGSYINWRRYPGLRLPVEKIWRRARVPFLGLSFCVIFAAGFYIGRVAPSTTIVADTFPSALRGMSTEHLDFQLESDLKRLKTIASGLEELAAKADRFRASVVQEMQAEGRSVYLPDETNEIRWMVMSYLSYRSALLRLLATYSGVEAVPDPTNRARSFMVGYAAAVTVFEDSLKLVDTYKDDRLARQKLNEPEPRWGIPANMFDGIYARVANSGNMNLATELATYFAHNKAEWRQNAVWTADEFDWLEKRITDGFAYVRSHAATTKSALLNLLITKVKQDLYTPRYAVQSIVAEWIGDTQLVEREPFITLEQIESIEERLKPGDIIIERRNWFLSNAFLPGFWPHAALYVGRIEDLRDLGIAERPEIVRHRKEYTEKASDGRDHTVIDAVSEGVIFNSLTHSMHADHVAVLRPQVSDQQKEEAIVRGFSHDGKPYDFEFNFATEHVLVCTEVVWGAYAGMLNFALIDVIGRLTLPAMEIVKKYVEEKDAVQPEL